MNSNRMFLNDKRIDVGRGVLFRFRDSLPLLAVGEAAGSPTRPLPDSVRSRVRHTSPRRRKAPVHPRGETQSESG